MAGKKILLSVVDLLLIAAGVVLMIYFYPAFQYFQLLTTMSFPYEIALIIGALLGISLIVFPLIALIMVLVSGTNGKMQRFGLHPARMVSFYIFLIFFFVALALVTSNPSVTVEDVTNFIMTYVQSWQTYAIIGGTIITIVLNIIGSNLKGTPSAVLKIISLAVAIITGIFLFASLILDMIFLIVFVILMIALALDAFLPLFKEEEKPNGPNNPKKLYGTH